MAVARMSVNSSMVLSILDQPSEYRKTAELEQIVRYLGGFKFFQDIIERQNDSELLHELARSLALKTFVPGQLVFSTGDQADCFYFILKGTVKIFSNTYIDLEETGDEELHKQIRKNLEVAHPRAKKHKESAPEIEVATLFPGEAFGEMAIINEKPRYYTAVASDDVYIAALNKNEFFKVEGSREKQVNEKMDFLRTNEAFKTWSRISIYNLAFYFKEAKFRRGAKVYFEGDPPLAIYLIKEGEFKFTQRFSINAGNRSIVEAKESKESSAFKSVRTNTIRYKELQIVTKQVGEIFGAEEVMEKQPARAFTCTCISQTGRLYWITERNFSKKVTHPESIKIIEEQCKVFKEWAVPRLAQLKQIELYKDDTSFTPYQKLKVGPRSFTAGVSQRIFNYSESGNDFEITMPAILKNIMTTRNSSTETKGRKTSKKKGGYLMFSTEVEAELVKGKSAEYSYTRRYADTRDSLFVPAKLIRNQFKKIKTLN